MNFLSLIKRNLAYKLKKKISVDTDNINLTTLDELFYHYGSDKAEIFKITNKKSHGFSKFYEKKLTKLKKKKIKYFRNWLLRWGIRSCICKVFARVKRFLF